MYLFRIYLLIIAFSILLFSSVSANTDCIEEDKGFRNNKAGRGWFWGQSFCKPKQDNTTLASAKTDNNINTWKILPEKANIPWEILDKLDPDEIANKIEPEAKKVSVMYPTDENIMAYRKLSNWILAKATAYTSRDTQVKVENPMLVPVLYPLQHQNIKLELFGMKESRIKNRYYQIIGSGQR